MPVSCAPADIAQDATCFTCQPEKRLAGMMVYLLAQQWKAIDPMAIITPSALASVSQCYTAELSGKGLLGAMVYLECQILAGGGGGGGAGADYLLEYPTPGDLPAAPADVTKVWRASFLDNSPEMRWSPGSTPPSWI